MEKFVIHGGRPLVGEVTISGAKNAAVAILPATILAADKCIIENLPSISDVAASLDILSAMGARVRVLDKHTAEVDTSHICTTSVPDELSRQMRASYYFLGALLGRFGKGTVAMPGGCYLGPRPIDQHLKAFTALGAEDVVYNGMIEVSGKRGQRAAYCGRGELFEHHGGRRARGRHRRHQGARRAAHARLHLHHHSRSD